MDKIGAIFAEIKFSQKCDKKSCKKSTKHGIYKWLQGILGKKNGKKDAVSRFAMQEQLSEGICGKFTTKIMEKATE